MLVWIIYVYYKSLCYHSLLNTNGCRNGHRDGRDGRNGLRGDGDDQQSCKCRRVSECTLVL